MHTDSFPIFLILLTTSLRHSSASKESLSTEQCLRSSPMTELSFSLWCVLESAVTLLHGSQFVPNFQLSENYRNKTIPKHSYPISDCRSYYKNTIAISYFLHYKMNSDSAHQSTSLRKGEDQLDVRTENYYCHDGSLVFPTTNALSTEVLRSISHSFHMPMAIVRLRWPLNYTSLDRDRSVEARSGEIENWNSSLFPCVLFSVILILAARRSSPCASSPPSSCIVPYADWRAWKRSDNIKYCAMCNICFLQLKLSSFTTHKNFLITFRLDEYSHFSSSMVYIYKCHHHHQCVCAHAAHSPTTVVVSRPRRFSSSATSLFIMWNCGWIGILRVLCVCLYACECECDIAS